MLKGVSRGRAARLAAASAGVLMLAGCQAATIALDKQELDVQTHMSETVFLDPVSPSEKTIYISARNTSDHPEIDLKQQIAAKLRARGYTIVDDPKQAHFMMQMNVLQAGPVDPAQKNAFLSSGYGSALDGVVAGAAAGGLTSYATGSTAAGVGVGAAVGVASFLADRMVKDVFFTVVSDIQISVRPAKGATVRETTTTNRNTSNSSATKHATTGKGASEGVSNSQESRSGNSNHRSQTVDSQSDFIKYNVRDVGYANQVNLKWENAAPLLIDRISNGVANLYE